MSPRALSECGVGLRISGPQGTCLRAEQFQRHPQRRCGRRQRGRDRGQPEEREAHQAHLVPVVVDDPAELATDYVLPEAVKAFMLRMEAK